MWYLGNIYYNIFNKKACIALGKNAAGASNAHWALSAVQVSDTEECCLPFLFHHGQRLTYPATFLAPYQLATYSTTTFHESIHESIHQLAISLCTSPRLSLSPLISSSPSFSLSLPPFPSKHMNSEAPCRCTLRGSSMVSHIQ